MKQDYESARPVPSTGVMPQHTLREAMRRAEGANPGRAIGLNAVEASTAVPIPPTLNHVGDELDRLHDRLDGLLNAALSLAQSLDAKHINEPPPWPAALDVSGIAPRLTNSVMGLHHKLGIAHSLLEAAGRAI